MTDRNRPIKIRELEAARAWQEEPCLHPDGPAGRMTCVRCLVERINFHNPEVCVDVQEYADRLKSELARVTAERDALLEAARFAVDLIEGGQWLRRTPMEAGTAGAGLRAAIAKAESRG